MYFLFCFFDLFYTYKCQYTAILGLDFLIENCVIDILILLFCVDYVISFCVYNYVIWISKLFQKRKTRGKIRQCTEML